jgi:hypothetical protein
VPFYIVGYQLKSDKKLWQSFGKFPKHGDIKPQKTQENSKFVEKTCPCFSKDILPKEGGGGDFKKEILDVFNRQK